MPTDPEAARSKYRRHARHYDRRGADRIAEVRKQLVARLRLRPGDTVVDVACGTGLSFAPIQDAIGESGHLIGIDLSADMLERARERVASSGWKNVTLIEGAVEQADLGREADALIFCLTHDVLQSPRALENVLGYAKAGARVAAFGPQWAPWWAFPLNLALYLLVRRYATTTEGLSRPWELLARFAPNLEVEKKWLGSFYLAWGVIPR